MRLDKLTKQKYPLVELQSHIDFELFRPLLTQWYLRKNQEVLGALLKTEGKKYSLVQPVIPMGMGFKWNVGDKASFAIEAGMRKTFTDYIDDVSTTYVDPVLLTAMSGPASAAMSDRSSYIDTTIKNTGRQRGNSKNKDWYGFVGLSLSFQIYELPEPCNAYDH